MADQPKRAVVDALGMKIPSPQEQSTKSMEQLQKAPLALEHPEKPAFEGGAFKIVDGNFVRVRNTNLPLPPECVAFICKQFRENAPVWRRFIDETIMKERPEEWLYPLNNLCFAYYPEGGSGGVGILQILDQLLATMEYDSGHDPMSYRADEVRRHFEWVATAKNVHLRKKQD
jgi:hypothetical protein